MNNEKYHVWKYILFPLAGKGGVGKTSFLAYLLALLGDRLNPVVYDYEEGNNKATGLSRYHPEATKLHLHEKLDLDQIINEMEEKGHAMTVVDLPANSGSEFLHWVKVIPWDALREDHIQLIAFATATKELDSLRLILPWVKELAHKVKYLQVWNEGLGEEFRAWRSEEGVGFILDFAPIEIRFPAIPTSWAVVLENQGKTIFSDPAEVQALLKLRFMDRHRLSLLQQAIRKEFQPVVDLLTGNTPKL